MFELYQTQNGSRGSLAEVWINKTNKLVKKVYKNNGITIKGTKPLYKDEKLKQLYENEIFWSTTLRSEYILNVIDYGELKDESGYFLIQEYEGPDLLYYSGKNYKIQKEIPTINDQILEIFNFYREHNVYKFNNAMCNMVLTPRGKIKAFDFKYAEYRNIENKTREIYSIDTWISKIDPTLPERILPLL